MPGARDLKRRIKSIGSTKKITRAMQMVSAAKMRKAQVAALASRTYSDLAWQIVTDLSQVIDPKYHALLQRREDANNTVAVILITTNRGLVGSFNTNLVHALNKYLTAEHEEVAFMADLLTVGRKGRDAMLRQGNTLVAEFEKYDRIPVAEEVMPIAKMIIDEYLKGAYSKVLIAYTHYLSIVSQKPVIKTLLPFERDKAGAFTDITGREEPDLPRDYKQYHFDYLFEPDPAQVLDKLLPRILESQIYQAILESDASEHSSRMVMMKNATDAASELISELTLTYNQIRQGNITKELSEITAGRIALE